MKKIIFLFNLFVISAIYGDIYSDRMLVYIDNSVANFQVDESTGRTNLEELNKKLDNGYPMQGQQIETGIFI